MVTFQVIASLGADVELGDVTGALLESAVSLIFVSHPAAFRVYTLNNFWKYVYRQMGLTTAQRGGSWRFPLSFVTPSVLDECVFMFYDPDSKALAGILCLHVDDMLPGGRGTAYRQTVNALRSRFPFRKWKNQREFCGSLISQDFITKEITVSQITYALKVNKVTVRARARQRKRGAFGSVMGQSSGWPKRAGQILPCR